MQLFILFCPTRDDESTECEVFCVLAHHKNGKISTKHYKSIIRGFTNLGHFLAYEILILLKCAVDSGQK